MVRNGWKVTVLAPNGERWADFEVEGIRGVIMRRGLPSQMWQLFTLIRSLRPDALVAADYVALLRVAIWRCFKRCRTIFIKAGGPLPNYLFPPVEEGVVFSEELASGFADRKFSSETSLTLVRERIDREFFAPQRLSTVCKPIEIVICMRIVTGKLVWLDNFFLAINALTERQDMHFTVIGGGDRFQDYQERAMQLNRQTGRELVTLCGEITDRATIRSYYYASHVTVGHGRGILEAMSCGRPAIILGTRGSSEWVSENTVAAIESYNFSGRHLSSDCGQKLATLLTEINPERLAILSEWSSDYVRRRYDLASGGKKLMDICMHATALHKRREFVAWLWKGRHL